MAFFLCFFFPFRLLVLFCTLITDKHFELDASFKLIAVSGDWHISLWAKEERGHSVCFKLPSRWMELSENAKYCVYYDILALDWKSPVQARHLKHVNQYETTTTINFTFYIFRGLVAFLETSGNIQALVINAEWQQLWKVQWGHSSWSHI